MVGVRDTEARAFASSWFLVHTGVAHEEHGEGQDYLSIVDLDPKGNGNFAEPRIVNTLPVGNSAVEGHSGHDDVTFDADGRWAFFTNPGDGTLANPHCPFLI